MILLITRVQNWMAAQFDLIRDDEEGMTTTEIAVATFLLVGAAIVVMGIIFTAASDNANNIPVPEAPAP